MDEARNLNKSTGLFDITDDNLIDIEKGNETHHHHQHHKNTLKKVNQTKKFKKLEEPKTFDAGPTDILPKVVKTAQTGAQVGTAVTSLSTIVFYGIFTIFAIYSVAMVTVFTYNFAVTYLPFFNTELPALKNDISDLKMNMTTVQENMAILASALNITLTDNDTFILSQYIYDSYQGKYQDVINNETLIAITSITSQLLVQQGINTNVATDLSTLFSYYLAQQSTNAGFVANFSTIFANLSSQQIRLDGFANNISTLFLNFLNQQLQINGLENNITFLFSNDGLLQLQIDGHTFNISTLFSNVAAQTVINNYFNNTLNNLLTSMVFDAVQGKLQSTINAETLASIANLYGLFNNLTFAFSNTTNGTIYSFQVYDLIQAKNQQSINAELYTDVSNLLNAHQRLVRVEVFGNDATCQIGSTYPCATLNGALTLLGNASLTNSYSIKIGAGVFTSIPGGTSVPFPCGIDIEGRETNTYLQLAYQEMNVAIMNASSNCNFVIRNMYISITGYMNLTAVGSSVPIFTSTFENITFVNSAGPVILTGNSGFCWTNFIFCTSNGGFGSITFNDMYIVASSNFFNNAVNIYQTIKDGFAQFFGFMVGNGGFHVYNQLSTGTTQIFLYNGNNAGSQTWDITTATNGTTKLRGDATVGMINSNGQGGPIQLGNGTLTVERETYAIGIAYYSAVTSLWTNLGLSIPTTVQVAIDNLIFYLNSLDGRVIALEIPVAPNQNIYVETFGNDATCVINNINKPCATLDRVQQLIPNMTSDQVPWNVYLGGGYFFMSASSTLGCNQNWWGKESTRIYMTNTLSPDPAKVAGAGSGYCQNRFFGITFFIDSGTTTLDYSATGLQILGFIFTNVTFAGSSTILHISAPNNPLSYINFFQVNYQGTLILDNFYFGAYWSGFGNPVLINSFFNKNLVYGLNQDIFYSYLNVSTYGSSPSGFTLLKMYLCYEEQGAPTLFNFYGNNSLSVLECDSASCGLTNVNEGSFSGSATTTIRRNTNAKGVRLDQCVASNWNGAICPAELNSAVNQIVARLKTVETNVAVSTFSISASYDGIWGSTQVATLSGYKIGNMVTLYFNPVVFTVTTSALISCSSIPPAFYPSNTMTMPIIVVDDSSFVNGAIQFNGAGTIFIGVSYANPGNGLVYQLQNFQILNTGGLAATSITYFL